MTEESDIYYASPKPDFEVFASEEWIKEEKKYIYCVKVGQGFRRKDKKTSLIELSAIPLTGKLYLVEVEEDKYTKISEK